MEHDKLLELIKGYVHLAGLRMDVNCWLLLGDIVELHKPYTDLYFVHCAMCQQVYPCDTIKVVEKELL